MTDQCDIENKIDIDDAVGRLPDRLRVTFELYKIGFSQEEIAEGLSVNQSSVCRRLEKVFDLLKNA